MAGTLGPLAGPTKLDPNLDIATAFKQIEAQRQAQMGAVQNFGTTQDSNLQKDYTGLQQGLTSSIAAQKQNYDTGAGNIARVYQNAGDINSATSAQVQGGVREQAQRMGLDSKALSDVQGKLAIQAAAFGQRNAQSEAGRVSSMNELGAKMGAVQQLGIQSAQKAEAQGRSDLAKRITTEVQRVQTAAQQAQADFTGVKSQQLARQTLQAEAQIKQATSQLMSEQRQARSQAMSEQRQSMAMSRMAQSQANSDRNFAFRQQQASGKMDPLSLYVAEQTWAGDHPKQTIGGQAYQTLYDQAMGGGYGKDAKGFINYMLSGASIKDAEKKFPKVKNNENQILGDLAQMNTARKLN